MESRPRGARAGVSTDPGLAPGRGPGTPRRFAAAAMGARRSPVVRLIASLAISAVFLAITVSRVDLGETALALASAAPGGILLAIALVLVELTIRA